MLGLVVHQHLEISASQYCLNRDATLSWCDDLELQGGRKTCFILPATVVTIHMEGRFCFLQAQTGKRVVESQCNITNAVDPIWFIVYILPIWSKARGTRRIVTIEVIIQLRDDFLIDNRFKLACKEGWSCRLLWGRNRFQKEKLELSSWIQGFDFWMQILHCWPSLPGSWWRLKSQTSGEHQVA